ncbi:MFS transporter [Polaromonas sp. A23]|uniref:MFS transporter n=1 Tax=Polaromonas sp. A23 TaxID=1944133 RepID=UPI0009848D3A|nr:MFS transporter [Polaromonas sp. A23]OOG41710.1 MFS transporter [Polaromonas sp. A23]
MSRVQRAAPLSTTADASGLLPRKAAIVVFLAFAAAYFCSTLVRAITATLAPVLTQEFSLHARDLGLLAGGYFLGFAATQLPLGTWLDRHGPKRVILCFLSLAVLACLAFSAATSFTWMLLSRVMLGMGVSACLMAPLTGYRRWFDAGTLLRANSWMLMTGSLGMLASTLPVQWLMPLTGWRPLFWILAGLILLSMLAIAWVVPSWHGSAPAAVTPAQQASYSQVWRSRYFQKMAPLAFFNYGGLLAIQTLWAGPWMIRVGGYTPLEAATGLFWINAAMLLTFWAWGLVNPWLSQHGWSANRLITWGVPVSLTVLALNIAAGPATGWVGWALFCMGTSVMGLAQPAVGMAFPQALAGRALSAYNLVIFAGVFVVQWGIGLLIDAFLAMGLSRVASFQAALGVFFCCCIASYAFFHGAKADPAPATADNS